MRISLNKHDLSFICPPQGPPAKVISTRMRCLPSLPPDLQAAQQPPCWQQKSTWFQLIRKRGARGFWEAENEHLLEKQTHNKQPSNAWLLYLHHTQAKHRFSARSYTQIHLKTTAHKHSCHKFWGLGFVRGIFCWKDANPAILNVWKAAIAAKSELNQLLNTSTNYPDVGKTSHAHVSQKHWRLWDESQQWRGCHAWKDTVMTWDVTRQPKTITHQDIFFRRCSPELFRCKAGVCCDLLWAGKAAVSPYQILYRAIR